MMDPSTDQEARLQFVEEGFFVVRGLFSQARCRAIRNRIQRDLHPPVDPVEYEADMGYPGAPSHRDGPGGSTPRRLLKAYTRHPLFRELATDSLITGWLQRLSWDEDWQLSLCHHNCVMTKAPNYSSQTHWHQDIRYWSFDRPELISAWVALGDEQEQNGGLNIIPGSHALELPAECFDEQQFLRTDLSGTQSLIKRARRISMSSGDALFFHCRAIHAAGSNDSQVTKLACVFTYHRSGNQPKPGTRSAESQSVPL